MGPAPLQVPAGSRADPSPTPFAAGGAMLRPRRGGRACRRYSRVAYREHPSGAGLAGAAGLVASTGRGFRACTSSGFRLRVVRAGRAARDPGGVGRGQACAQAGVVHPVAGVVDAPAPGAERLAERQGARPVRVAASPGRGDRRATAAQHCGADARYRVARLLPGLHPPALDRQHEQRRVSDPRLQPHVPNPAGPLPAAVRARGAGALRRPAAPRGEGDAAAVRDPGSAAACCRPR